MSSCSKTRRNSSPLDLSFVRHSVRLRTKVPKLNEGLFTENASRNLQLSLSFCRRSTFIYFIFLSGRRVSKKQRTMSFGLFGPSVQQQQEMLRQAYEMKQFEETLMSVSRITELCFVQCAQNFRLRKLDNEEELCMHRCAAKYIKLGARAEPFFLEAIGGGAMAAIQSLGDPQPTP